MTLAQEIADAWEPSYSVSLAEMVRTRGGYRSDSAQDQTEYELPDGSGLIHRHPGPDFPEPESVSPMG